MVLAWGFWPNPRQEADLPLTLPQSVAGQHALHWQVRLQTPMRLRLGETGRLTLTITPTGGEPDWEEISLLAEASLELPGFQLLPAATQLQALDAQQALVFTWKIMPQRIGTIAGVAPLNLHIYTLDGGPEQEYLLSAQPFVVGVYSLLGLDVTWLRLLGVTGSVVSIVLVVGFSLRKV
jgi:hypothetical protein